MLSRWVVVVLVLSGCGVSASEPTLRLDPATLDLQVGLDEPAQVTVRVFAATSGGETDVTADAQLALDGAPLGSLAGGQFTSDGRTGGRATITAAFQHGSAELPVHVTIHSTRRADGVPPAADSWFAAASDVATDATLEPGDGAVLPPNLGRFDVDFAAEDTDDVHQVTLSGPDLELRVLARGVAGPRHVELTAAEWDAVSRTSVRGTVQLAVRSLQSAAPAQARVATAQLAIADLAFAGEVLFTGAIRVPAGEPSQLWSYDLKTAMTQRWASGPGGTCIGCHVAISRDGKRIAAGGTDFNGVIVDATTRYSLSAPGPSVGTWNAATFDPGGALVTAISGTLTLRDGTTALPIKTLPTELPASQPAISPGGHALAYVGGPIDPVTTQPMNQELRVHDWDAVAGTLGAARVLVPQHGSDWVKLPEFSPDGAWVAFARGNGTSLPAMGLAVIRSDGTGAPIDLTTDRDDCARFASPIASAQSGAASPEPMTWIVMKSYRAVGPRSQGPAAQLWAMAFYPDRGAGSRPFHLPGQRPDVGVLHAPIAIAAPP